MSEREQMNIVFVGHVDHGKSTVIGRLLADTGALPEGKLEQVRARCERTARPFEYAFLLDALQDEQAQGITIDTARCFFKTARRDYIIIDAPGHVEFLKNMVSGAARAEAAVLVIDAHEGIAENTRRHGYLVSMLGIRTLVVLVNKMDLVGYRREVYDAIVREYSEFLSRLGMRPVAFVPVCARDGDNLAGISAAMPWYEGTTVLGQLDGLIKKREAQNRPLRFPVQDIYKFTAEGDDRRIIAGTVESGTLAAGDNVVFYPSGSVSRVASIEAFSAPPRASASAGYATGVTLIDEPYVRRGEIMCRINEKAPVVASQFRANIFWMGRSPLVREKKYKLKIAANRAFVRLIDVVSCIDASELSSIAGKQQLDRHDVAECVLETVRPIAFDTIAEMEATARFVVIDGYDIAGGGIITAIELSGRSWVGSHVRARETTWEKGLVTPAIRSARYGHGAKFVVVCGDERRSELARRLEKLLFDTGCRSYYTGVDNIRRGLDADIAAADERMEDIIWRLGELSRIMTDAGLIFITALGEATSDDIALLRTLNEPNEVLVVWFGAGDAPLRADLIFDGAARIEESLSQVTAALRDKNVIPDYSI